jgi:hypothetical protein
MFYGQPIGVTRGLDGPENKRGPSPFVFAFFEVAER